jgi:hypothetical protein
VDVPRVVENRGGVIFLYRPQKLVRPAKVESFVRETVEAARLFASS